jgi:predicted MFS family arabinose efflux permease
MRSTVKRCVSTQTSDEMKMTNELTSSDVVSRTRSGEWGAVYALTLCVSTLIASEFMPVSLLTPIATSLHLTEGHAGQAIAVSGMFAMMTSLSIAPMTQRLDRRQLLLALTILMMLSGLMVTLAPNYPIFMAGRALVGVVIGGFWSMSAAIVMRLVSEHDVPRALALLNGGNALATTVAAPLGSFLGQYIGWRGAFFCVVPLAIVTFIWLAATLPSMHASRRIKAGGAFHILVRPRVPQGMFAVTLFFMGQFALFTYLRPFLETVTHIDVSMLSLILLLLGGAGLLGTYLIGLLLRTRLYSLLIAIPLAMAVIATGLILFGASASAVAVLLMGWGLLGTAAPVGWWTWLSRVLPDDAEAGGGFLVATVQFAITLGATAGGVVFDRMGYQATFTASALLLCGAALAAFLASRMTVR